MVQSSILAWGSGLRLSLSGTLVFGWVVRPRDRGAIRSAGIEVTSRALRIQGGLTPCCLGVWQHRHRL